MTDDTHIIPQPFAEALGERYLSYALSTILSRSLPDVRDGLKPVHRRLLYAMRELGLGSARGHKKAARVVGDVIGKYHPHGEGAVYDTLVRLAQDFAQRYPLVDGQGNFGNIDGDNPAAMRYTEARLTAVAEALLDGIDEDAVDFRTTYDDEGEEPVVLPAGFPNLLANGAQGIAVGMATSIPPHNAGELCDALLHLLKTPNADPDSLLHFVQGPDFPTGGVLVEPAEAIAAAYRTGRGSFRLRARWTTEKLPQGQYQIVVTEIPHQVPKSRLIEKTAELITSRRLPLLADIRDESADDVRLILEPKSRTVDPEGLMEHLFRQTELEVRVGLNMNVVDPKNVPRVMTLKEVLEAFLEHRRVVLLRRSRHRLDKIDRRLEILDGLLVVYLNIDEVIRIVRFEDDPKAELIRRFDLTETQADAVLNMRLRALHKLEEIELRKEHESLSAEKAELQALLDDPAKQRRSLGKEIREIKKRFGQDTPLGRRRTTIGTPPLVAPPPLETAVEREPITVLLSEKGWIRTVRGHQPDMSEAKYKEGDRERFVLHAETTDRLLVFASNGRFYTLGCDKLPRGKGYGEPVRLMIDLAQEAEIVTVLRHDPERTLILAASDGRGFRVAEAEVAAQTRAGKQVMTVGEGVRAAMCWPVTGDTVAVLGTNRKLLCFPVEEVPQLARGRGAILQRYKDADLADLVTFNHADGLSWPSGDRRRTETDLTPWLGARGQAGRQPPRGFPKTNRFA
ncbi:MAG: DNA topoisomerase IV subunit A [Alphaproteobacteria bacterium]|nr:DNA topoisomerase IV subunit A [Alphaproteobacteria bacterium]